MTLYEFLDDVRCGNVGRLCVAICREVDFLGDYLENFRKGQYWELKESNWHAGSASPATPDLPEEILEAEVTQVECAPNIPEIYAHIDGLTHNNWNYTIVLVEEPEDFNAEEYWTEDKLHEPISRDVWLHAINKEKWYDIQNLEPNWMIFRMAVGIVGSVGYLSLRDYTDEQFAEMSPMNAQVYRLAKKISWRVKGIDEVMAMLQLTEMGSAFRRDVTRPCDKYEPIPYKDLWADSKNDDAKVEDTYQCSTCGAELQPTIKELKSGHFVCHKCSAVLNPMEYEPTVQCCVCGGINVLTKEENEKGEFVCSHCSTNLRFVTEDDTGNENTDDEE